MKRILVLVLALSLLAGCAGGKGEEKAYYFTDDLGRVVELKDRPERVACLLGSFADVWALAGGTVIAAPDDAWEDFDLEMPDEAVVLGSAKNLSLELLLSAEPELVIASSNTPQHMEWLDTLEAAEIPVAYFHVADFQDYMRLLKICTDLTEQPERYGQYGNAVQAQIDQVLSFAEGQPEKPTVLYLRLAASGIRVKNSEGNVLGQMLKKLGCVNIADSDTVLLETLSMEHILLSDPDFIFLVQQGDDAQGAQQVLDQFIRDNPAWQELTAVKEGRVHTLEKELYSLKPNDRWGEAYEHLAGLIWE